MIIDRSFFAPKSDKEVEVATIVLHYAINETGHKFNISPTVVIEVLRAIADNMDKQLDEYIEKFNKGEVSMPNWG